MPRKSVEFDRVKLDYLRVDVLDDRIIVGAHIAVESSTTGYSISKDVDATNSLTPGHVQALREIVKFIQKTLEERELG